MLSGRRPDRVDQHRCKTMPGQCRLYKGKLQRVHQGLPWGHCRVTQHWQPADLLALHGKEARSHADAQVHAALIAASQLGWEIHSEFRRIPWLFWFWTFWTPEFSSEFYFSDRKMCSCQFWTRFFRFGILSRHLFFQFHESENILAINVFLARHENIQSYIP